MMPLMEDIHVSVQVARIDRVTGCVVGQVQEIERRIYRPDMAMARGATESLRAVFTEVKAIINNFIMFGRHNDEPNAKGRQEMGLELEVHYPTALPIGAAKHLIAGLTGGTLGANLPLDCEAAWNLAGYALGVSVGHPDHLIGAVGDVAIDDAKATALLTEAVAHAEAGDHAIVGAAAIPWGPLAAYLLQLLLDRLLKK